MLYHRVHILGDTLIARTQYDKLISRESFYKLYLNHF